MADENIQKAFSEVTAEFKTLLETQAEEIRKNGETSKETASKIVELEKSMQGMAEDHKSNEIKLQGRIDELEAKSQRLMAGGNGQIKTIGRQFTESKAYENVKNNGFRGESAPVEIKAITNDAISGDAASAGGLLTPYLRDAILQDPQQPIFVHQLLRQVPVNTDAVQLFREVAFNNEAGIQGAPATSGGKTKYLQEKPQSDIVYDTATVNIETLAHWIIASRQILSDVPRLEAQINDRLVYGLNLVLDKQVLYGDGAGQNFGGLMTDTDVQDAGGATGTAIDHIRHAITMAQLKNYYNINGIVMNPVDWETIETAKGSDGHYIWVNVQVGGTTQLWRVPVVVSNSMEAGDFILGDWTMGAALYNREGVTVRTSESHADLFVRNGVAILAELRAGLGIELPLAFVKGSFDAATTTA